VTRRASVSNKRKAEAAAAPGGRAPAADYGEDMIVFRPNKRSSAPEKQAAAAGPKRAAPSQTSSKGGTKRGSVDAGDSGGVGSPAPAGVMTVAQSML
jgi:hypothetical protein